MGNFLEDVYNEGKRTVNHITGAIGGATHIVGEGLSGIGNAVGKAANDNRNTLDKATVDVYNANKKLFIDTPAAIKKAKEDFIAESKRAQGHAQVMEKALEHFVENEETGAIKELSDAENRIREGKVLDAIYHMVAAPTNVTEENWFKATEESQWLEKVGAIAIDLGGSPIAASFYAAWHTYKSTGGQIVPTMISATVAADAAVIKGKFEEKYSKELMAKAAFSAAISAIAVIVNGGKSEERNDAAYWDFCYTLVSEGGAAEPKCILTSSDRQAKTEAIKQDTKKNLILVKPDGKEIIIKTNQKSIWLVKDQWILSWNDALDNKKPITSPILGLTYVGQIPLEI